MSKPCTDLVRAGCMCVGCRRYSVGGDTVRPVRVVSALIDCWALCVSRHDSAAEQVT